MPMRHAIRQFPMRLVWLFKLWSCFLLLVILPLDLLFRADSFLLSMTWGDLISAAAGMVLLLLFLAALIALLATLCSLTLSFLWSRLRHAGSANGTPETGMADGITPHILLLVACYFFARSFKIWVTTFQYEITIKAIIIGLILAIIIYVPLRRTFQATTRRFVAETWRFVLILTVCCGALAGWRLLSEGAHNRHGVREHALNNVKNTAANSKRPDIILITFDALSAEDMSLYGYHLNTTPNLDAFARQCTVFDKAIAAANWTRPSVMSLMTGNYPDRHRLINAGQLNMWSRNPAESLPALLKAAGYRNEAIVTNWGYAHPYTNGLFPYFEAMPLGVIDFETLPRRGAFFHYFVPVAARWGGLEAVAWLREMKDMALNLEEVAWLLEMKNKALNLNQTAHLSTSRTPYPPSLVFAEAARHLAERSATPRFFWLHLFVPHEPYLPPPPYSGSLGSGQELQRHIPLHEGYFSARDAAAIARLRLVYDEYIRYADAALGDFLQELRRTGRLDTSLIIVSADHGESFSHGFQGHGGIQMYRPLVHIPLLIHLPKQTSGIRIAQTVSQTDIAPTILGLLDVPSSCRMDGRSLTPLLEGHPLPPRSVFSMNLDGNPIRGRITKGSVAVIGANYKYIRHLKPELEELYDMRNDPDERKNLINLDHTHADYLRGNVLDRINLSR
jgi:arylsulfatase A-like enzyme